MLITNIHGLIGEDVQRQNNWLTVAKSLGAREVPIFAYNDDGEEKTNQDQRIENILAGVDTNETLVMQIPTHIGFDFDNNLIDHLYQRPGARLILILNAIPPLMIKYHANLAPFLRFCNRADAMIVQTEQLRTKLRHYGLNHPDIIVSECSDTVLPTSYGAPAFSRDIQYAGKPEELDFQEWHADFPLTIYSDQHSITGADYQPASQLALLTDQINKQGGFGLVSTQNKWGYGGYRQLMMPDEVSLYLASGLPLLAQEGTATAALIERYQLGLVYHGGNDLTARLKTLDSEQYEQLAKNVSQIGQMVRKGLFGKRALLKAAKIVRLTAQEQDSVAYSDCIPPIKVMNTFDTLDYIDQHHPSICRFGDGEVDVACGIDRDFQKADPVLTHRLRTILAEGSNEHLLVCLPDIFNDLSFYTDGAQGLWLDHVCDRHDYYCQIAKKDNIYGDTELTRPFMAFQDSVRAGQIFQRIKKWWAGKDVLIAEGKYTRFGTGNDLLDGARSVQRIICPAHNAWSKYKDIEDDIYKYGKGKLVLLSLGMTATVISADLATFTQMIDIGHLDPEYEWMKLGVTERVPFKNKHSAEFNGDEMVKDEFDDPVYKSQIVADLTK